MSVPRSIRVDSGNRVLRLVDSSPTSSGSAATSFKASAGTRYTASVPVYLAAGSAPVSLYLKFYDHHGTELLSSHVISPDATSAWHSALSTTVTSVPPDGTTQAEVILYCPLSSLCDAYFDDVVIVEKFDNTYYVAPTGSDAVLGKNTPSSPTTLNNDNMWEDVVASLATGPVRVVIADGNYIIASDADALRIPRGTDTLSSCGSAGWTETSRLLIEGASAHGVSIKATGAVNHLVRICNSNNVTVRNIHLTANTVGTISTGIQFYAGPNRTSKGIRVEGLTVREMTSLRYGALSFYAHQKAPGTFESDGQVEDVQVRYSDFIRNGYDPGAHHIYVQFGCSSDPAHLRPQRRHRFRDHAGLKGTTLART